MDNTHGNIELDCEQANNFFSSWRNLLSPISISEQMHEFFSLWSSLPPERPDSHTAVDFSTDQLTTFANELRESYRRHYRSGEALDVWQAAGIGSDEIRNCQVLSWIIDRFGDHGQGSAILKIIITSLAVQTKIKVNDETIYWTRVESRPLGDPNRRVDIEIYSACFVIFIEAKIHAKESCGQIDDYVKLAEKQAAGRNWAVIFLTIDGRDPAEASLKGKVISLSWRQIASILDNFVTNNNETDFAGRIFKQYASHLRNLL